MKTSRVVKGRVWGVVVVIFADGWELVVNGIGNGVMRIVYTYGGVNYESSVSVDRGVEISSWFVR